MTPSRCIFDLSHNNPLKSTTYAQDDALFAQAKAAGWIAMMHKLTQGTAFVDPVALGRLASGNRVGLLLGGYHYLTADPAANQVANFMHVAGQVKTVIGAAPFVYMLDFEPDAGSDATTTAAGQFVTAVQAVTGRWPLLYTGRWDVSPNVTGTNLPACPLMLAEYGTDPIPPPGWINWAIHQYSDGTQGPDPVTIPGVGAVDQSEFSGSAAELAMWWKGGTI